MGDYHKMLVIRVSLWFRQPNGWRSGVVLQQVRRGARIQWNDGTIDTIDGEVELFLGATGPHDDNTLGG